MADLTEQQAGGTTKVIGSDLTGNETNFLGITDEGELKVASFPNLSYISSVKTINTIESIGAVGVSNLSNRKSLSIYNKGAQDIYYGPTGVTDTTGIPIFKDEVLSLDIGDGVDLYLVTKTGSATVIVQEFA